MGAAKRHRALTFEEVSARIKRVHEGLFHEEEALCAVIIASFINDVLGALLRQHFIDSSTVDGVLNPSGGILATMRAKSDVAYCLGLITKPCKINVDLIGEIRNKFAHTTDELSFNSPEITELCNNLIKPKYAAIFSADPEESRETDAENYGTPRRRFETISGTVCITLYRAALKALRCTPLAQDADGAF